MASSYLRGAKIKLSLSPHKPNNQYLKPTLIRPIPIRPLSNRVSFPSLSLSFSLFPSQGERKQGDGNTLVRPCSFGDSPQTESKSKMEIWVFGYGSLIWKAGFNYDERLFGFVKGYRRVFYQGSTDHRGTPEFPGRTVTLEPAEGEVCYGVAYKISKKEDQEIALTYLEVREKQYDQKAYVDFFTESAATVPAVSGVIVYIASPNKKLNVNYLGPASTEEIAKQIVKAEGPSGPNRDYLFQLEKALLQYGCKDEHVVDIANEVRRILSEKELTSE